MVSNREPCIHEHVAEGIKAIRPASGMVTAIEPIVQAVGGTWIAHGSGSADRLVVDKKGRIRLPQEEPKYTLRRVWLTKKEEDGYYYGLSNKAIWPLCHIVYTRPHFSRSDWEIYQRVNQIFCEAVLEEAEGAPAIVFIQDYHLALLPRLLKRSRPDLKLIQFWHIPWPNREAFRIFPWGEEFLDGLLGNDILGFHLQYHCNNFLDTVDRGIEARVDYEHFCVFRGGRPTYVRPFPISVDYEQIGTDSSSSITQKRRDNFLKELGEESSRTKLFIGADRIDYTKGIPERLQGFDLMLRRHPELLTKVTFLQLAAPSRTHIEEYRNLNDALDDMVDEINWRHQTEEWSPIRFLRAHHDYYAVLAAYRMADVCVVTSLHDGMNLVAKEFVSSRIDGDGVLLLSRYTGAARELSDALLVNPYDTDELADTMHEAYLMSEAERYQRMQRMRSQVEKNSVYEWGNKIFAEIEKILGSE
ncbi:MAG: trehalose-6-phosphate synthase [Candidatus Tectomicrobia bacterium]|uniref:Trehalose-6-phosphate synthase n=1 Tax=Tectimicrobiota bacterium TaxID=2528274 RepID=A0A933LQ60_UNCTE|nr:trehalose-6-phosphate synthase [Candidatus Tectomicrobia bacterium]